MKESRYNVWSERGADAYVFNSASGALLRVDRAQRHSLAKALSGRVVDGVSPRMLTELALGRMIVADEVDEVDQLRTLYQATRADRSHFAITVVTSLGCNFDCPYCFEAKHPSILDADTEAALLRLLDAKLPETESLHVTWFGGEPLVGKRPLLDLSDAFIDRCVRADVEYSASIVTNGYLLDVQTCRDLQARRVSHTQVTLDGPPDVHDRMRPLVSGRGTFWKIVEKLKDATDFLDITVRVNVDSRNMARVEELFEILVAAGLGGKISVYPAQLVGITSNLLAPSATYSGCFTNPEFARAEAEFLAIAEGYGFAVPTLPRATGAPCTAVRANEVVVGSRGELYKCWDSVGDHREVIGHISDYDDLNGRLAKWLTYDPFDNEECVNCVALPVCMGGCAHHAFDSDQYENRCGTFKHNHLERVNRFVEHAKKNQNSGLTYSAAIDRQMETR